MPTIEFFTGFEGCESDDDVKAFFDGGYEGPILSETGGYSDGKCMRFTHESFSSVDRPWTYKNGNFGTTLVLGQYIRNINTNSYDTDRAKHIWRLSNDNYIRVFNTSNGVEIYRDSTLIASSTTVITSSPHHIEMKVVIGESNGYVGFKLDGSLIIDEENINTGSGSFTQIVWANQQTNLRIDNIFIADDWIGALKTKLLQPTSDDSVQFTPSDGSDNYAMLQNNDGDDNYVYSDTVDHKDLYGYGPDIADDQYVKGVFVQQVARKDDTNARSLQTVMEVESIEYDLDEYVLEESYSSGFGSAKYEVLSKAPDDTEWTYEKVNGMKVGFKVSA